MKRFLLSLLVIYLTFASIYAAKTFDQSVQREHELYSNRSKNERNLIKLSQNETIYVHLIPHTHDDVGWLKTVDEYYYGSRNDIQLAMVQATLDTVTMELDKDRNKSYIYVEMAFLYRWWNEQDTETKNTFLKLIKNGQMEIINGGWCMNDEAAAYYEDIIDQMTLGHRFALEQLGVIPKVSWHIDPFGHSNGQAELFAQMGFNAFMFARVDYQDKVTRMNASSLEMIWKPNTTLGDANAIFTHINYNHYEAPSSFCFDTVCTDEPIKDDPTLEGYNINTRAADFVNYFRHQAQHYRSNHLMHTMGSDFQYSNAHWNFKNIDKLLKYIEDHSQDFPGIKIMYSTPSQYIGNVSAYPGLVLPEKTDDFFPYADEIEAYWTGYFTSRVNLKYDIRLHGRYLQNVRKLLATAYWNKLSSNVTSAINTLLNYQNQLEQALGVTQHHDAVTGTSTQRVTNDYYYILSKGVMYGDKILSQMFGNNNTFRCELNYTASLCNTSKVPHNGYIDLAVYNPGDGGDKVMRLKVDSGNWGLYFMSNYDVLCSNLTDVTDCDLYFVDYFKPNSVNYYILTRLNSNPNQILGKTLLANGSNTLQVNKNETLGLRSDANKDLFLNYTLLQNGTFHEYDFLLKYQYYRSFNLGGQPSGVYIFRPDNITFNNSLQYDSYDLNKGKLYQGKVVSEFSLLGNNTHVRIRMYNRIGLKGGIEVETFIQPINMTVNNSLPQVESNEIGKELVLKVYPLQGFKVSNQSFYTDSNGLEMQKRILNYRPTWKLVENQPVAGNYYPVNSAMYVKDDQKKIKYTILNDRSQGGSANLQNNGEMEIMIHRRIPEDDWRGMGEPLNETDADNQGMRVLMRHWITISEENVIEDYQRLLQYNHDNELLVVYNISSELNFPIVNNTLVPENLKYYFTLWNETSLLLRLHNLNDDKNVTLSNGIYTFIGNNGTMLNGRTVQNVTERSLSNNQNLQSMLQNKMSWPGINATQYVEQINYIQLKPQEIRTYMVYFQKNSKKSLSTFKKIFNIFVVL